MVEVDLSGSGRALPEETRTLGKILLQDGEKKGEKDSQSHYREKVTGVDLPYAQGKENIPRDGESG